MGAGKSNFVQNAVLVYNNPKSGTEVSKKIALSTIEDQEEVEDVNKVKNLLERNTNLRTVCSLPKYVSIKGELHAGTGSSEDNPGNQTNSEGNKTIGISVIQTDLMNHLYKNPNLTQIEGIDISKKVLTFIKKLIDNNIVHRDIKPDNLAFTDEKNITSIDNGSIREAHNTSDLIGETNYISKQLWDVYTEDSNTEVSKEDQQTSIKVKMHLQQPTPYIKYVQERSSELKLIQMKILKLLGN